MKSLILFLAILTLSTQAFSQEDAKKHHGHHGGHDNDKKCYMVPTFHNQPNWSEATEMTVQACKDKLKVMKFAKFHFAICECKEEHGHGGRD